MTRLKAISALSAAKVIGVMMGLVGIIFGVAYALGGALYELSTGTLNVGTALAFLAVLGMPLIFALAGFIAGAIGSFFYNLASRWVGGIIIQSE